jgi:tagatose 6-phosphate kinase
MILCLGTTPTVQRSMVFERVTSNAVNRAVEVLEGASGKSVNVARVLCTLGRAALATGFVGGDRGRFLLRELDRAGIPHDFVEVPTPTRLCITVMDRASGGHTELVEEAAAVDPPHWDELRARVQRLLGKARMLVMSGSLPRNGPVDFYLQCCRLAAAASVPVILDAAGPPLKAALAAGPLVVKPNRAELALTLGRSIDSREALLDAIRQLVQQGPRWAVVTMGAEGAVAGDGREAWYVAAPKVKAVNPIGSGDAFTAALAAALDDGQSMPEALLLAGACGAANALTPMSGVVHREDVQRLLGEVRVQRM